MHLEKFINDLIDMHWKCDAILEEEEFWHYHSTETLYSIKRNLEVLLLDAGHSLKGLNTAPREYSDE